MPGGEGSREREIVSAASSHGTIQATTHRYHSTDGVEKQGMVCPKTLPGDGSNREGLIWRTEEKKRDQDAPGRVKNHRLTRYVKNIILAILETRFTWLRHRTVEKVRFSSLIREERSRLAGPAEGEISFPVLTHHVENCCGSDRLVWMR